MKTTQFITLCGIFMIFITSGCKTTKVPAYSPAGKWNYKVNTRDGERKGWFTINQEGNSFSGTMNIDERGQMIPFTDLSIKNRILKANVTSGSGNKFILSGTFEGDNFKGKLSYKSPDGIAPPGFYDDKELDIIAKRE